MSGAVLSTLGLGFVGVVALGAVAWRTYGSLRSLGRVVADASGQVADATAALDAVAPEGQPGRTAGSG